MIALLRSLANTITPEDAVCAVCMRAEAAIPVPSSAAETAPSAQIRCPARIARVYAP